MMNRGLSGVGKRVKYLRNKSRISQEALAESFGLGYRTAISDYEYHPSHYKLLLPSDYPAPKSATVRLTVSLYDSVA